MVDVNDCFGNLDKNLSGEGSTPATEIANIDIVKAVDHLNAIKKSTLGAPLNKQEVDAVLKKLGLGFKEGVESSEYGAVKEMLNVLYQLNEPGEAIKFHINKGVLVDLKDKLPSPPKTLPGKLATDSILPPKPLQPAGVSKFALNYDVPVKANSVKYWDQAVELGLSPTDKSKGQQGKWAKKIVDAHEAGNVLEVDNQIQQAISKGYWTIDEAVPPKKYLWTDEAGKVKLKKTSYMQQGHNIGLTPGPNFKNQTGGKYAKPIVDALVVGDDDALEKAIAVAKQKGVWHAPLNDLHTPPTNPQPGVASQAKAAFTPKPKAEFKADSVTFVRGDKPPPIKLSPRQKNFGGTHPKDLYVDADDGLWLFKPAPDGDVFRTDAEHGAHEIAQLLGFDIPQSTVVRIGGRTGQLQKIIDGTDLTGVSPSTLTKAHRQNLAQQHLLDWMLSNDDSHAANFMRTPGGIVPIDKGRSYALWQEKLQLRTLDHRAHTYHSILHKYYGSTAGELDDTLKSVILRARGISASTDRDKLRASLRTAFANRTQFPGGRSQDQFIETIVSRLDTLEDDFISLWRETYAIAGREFPDVDELINRVPDKLFNDKFFAGHSAELLSDAIDNKSYGTPTFWAGADIEDGVELVWTEKVQDTLVHRTEMKLLKDADARIQAKLGNPLIAKPKDSVTFPNDDSFWADILNAAKTINYHHGLGDTNYNEKKIENLRSVLRALQKSGTGATAEQKRLIRQYTELAQDVLKKAEAKDVKLPQFLIERPKVKLAAAKVTKDPVRSWKVVDRAHDTGAAFGTFDGDLLTSTKSFTSGGGNGYVVELRSGAKVIYIPWTDNKISRRGAMQLITTDVANSERDMAEFRQFLSDMGVILKPADEIDMELMYWRRHVNSMKSYQTDTRTSAIIKQVESLPGDLLPEDEVAKIKRIVKAELKTTNTEVDWNPIAAHTNIDRPEAAAGWPSWRRPDVEGDRLIKALATSDGGFFPSASLTGSADRVKIVKNGGFASTEERIRRFGDHGGGMSPTADRNSGGASGIFARKHRSSGASHQVWFNPDLAERNSTYFFTSDTYGRVDERRSNPFDQLQVMSRVKNTGRSDEFIFRDGASVLDGIEVMGFSRQYELDEVLAFFKSKGIHTIRGIRVSDRYVMRNDLPRALRIAEAEYKRRRGLK